MGYPLAEELDDEYQLFDRVAPVIIGLSLVCVAVSTFLWRDDRRSHSLVGKVGDGFGFAAYVLTTTVQNHTLNSDAVDCRVHGRNCPTPPDPDDLTLPDLIWNIVTSLFAGFSLADFLLPAGAGLLGWGVSQLTTRPPPAPGAQG